MVGEPRKLDVPGHPVVSSDASRLGRPRITVSKLETPMTRRYWQHVGGTLIEEFPAITRKPDVGARRLDGLILPDGERRIATPMEVNFAGKDLIVVQAKASRLGMSVMGQALFSRELMWRFEPQLRSIRTVALCSATDAVLEPLCKRYDIEVFVDEVEPVVEELDDT